MAIALVTGGTSGIGATFARILAGHGDDLVLVARNSERLEAMATGISRAYGVQVEVIAADLADRMEVQRVVSRITDPDRPIDLLVNNAGFGVHSALTNPDTSAHEHALDVMCRAVLILAGAAGRTMRDRGRGAIINVSSTAGFVTMGSYSAVKAWVTTYTEGLAIELAGSGVTVTALCPGWVRTEFHQRAGIRTGKIPSLGWVDADELVRDCLHDVDRGKVISIPTRRYKIAIGLARVAPRGVIRAISAKLSASRRS